MNQPIMKQKLGFLGNTGSRQQNFKEFGQFNKKIKKYVTGS